MNTGIIQNEHSCITCGERLMYASELTSHKNKTGHKRYIQTYGSILLNEGNFHYVLTMLRSYVKLNWKLNLQTLCESINLDSPKALYMVEKVTSFRKVFDVVRANYQAKLQEIVYPFVKWAL